MPGTPFASMDGRFPFSGMRNRPLPCHSAPDQSCRTDASAGRGAKGAGHSLFPLLSGGSLRLRPSGLVFLAPYLRGPVSVHFPSLVPATLQVPIPPVGREEPKKPNLKVLWATKRGTTYDKGDTPAQSGRPVLGERLRRTAQTHNAILVRRLLEQKRKV